MRSERRQNSGTQYARMLALLLAVGQVSSLSQASGVDAIQLTPVALDSSIDCNRLFFQSSQNFRGTVFAMPRVVLGTGVERSRVYSVAPTNNPNEFRLTINLYFPSNDEVLMGSNASSFRRDVNACNFDQVKNAINRTISDPRLRIQTIARSPLTSIEIRIPGIQHAGLIGRSLENTHEADILDYYGKVLSAQILITKEELDLFQSQVVSSSGIGASIKFRFQARSSDGSVTARINVANLVADFQAAVSAQNLRALGAADLRVSLAASINDRSVTIVSEAGSRDLSKIEEMIIDKILKEVSFTVESSQRGEQTSASAADNATVSVAAVINVIRTKLNAEISFSNFAAPESATAQTDLKIQTDRIVDPNTSEIQVAAGYQSPTLGTPLEAGKMISISAGYWFTDRISYSEYSRYLTKSDLDSAGLNALFPSLLNPRMIIENVERNGTVLAEGRWQVVRNINLPRTYHWVRNLNFAVRQRITSGLFESSEEALSEMVVYVTFSTIGERRYFKFSDLFQENPYLTARWDAFTGRLEITAKRDLGIVTFRDRASSSEAIEYSAQPVILDQVIEKETDLWGRAQTLSTKVIRSDAQAIVKQRTIVLYVTRPTSPISEPQAIAPSPAPTRNQPAQPRPNRRSRLN